MGVRLNADIYLSPGLIENLQPDPHYRVIGVPIDLSAGSAEQALTWAVNQYINRLSGAGIAHGFSELNLQTISKPDHPLRLNVELIEKVEHYNAFLDTCIQEIKNNAGLWKSRSTKKAIEILESHKIYPTIASGRNILPHTQNNMSQSQRASLYIVLACPATYLLTDKNVNSQPPLYNWTSEKIPRRLQRALAKISRAIIGTKNATVNQGTTSHWIDDRIVSRPFESRFSLRGSNPLLYLAQRNDAIVLEMNPHSNKQVNMPAIAIPIIKTRPPAPKDIYEKAQTIHRRTKY